MNNLKWTKTVPTENGIYWWRLSDDQDVPAIVEVDVDYEFVYDIADPNGQKLKTRKGQWSGPIIPPDDPPAKAGDGRYCRHHDDDPAHGAICFDAEVYVVKESEALTNIRQEIARARDSHDLDDILDVCARLYDLIAYLCNRNLSY